MALSWAAFLHGIQQIESGGNYNAVGPATRSGDRAYGKYQIMGSNIAPWGKQYLGRNISITQYRNSPKLQEELAQAVLRSYYNKYGADGAAAKWFSGSANPNSNASDGYNTVRQYVAKMNKAAASYSGGSSGSSGGGAGSNVAPSIDPEELASQYGLSSFVINYYPELKALFAKAVAESWSAEKFTARLENSNWWKTHSKTEREWIVFNNTDPASATAKWVAEQHRINDLMAKWGIPGGFNNKRLLDEMVWGVIVHGWTDAQVKYQASNNIEFSKEGTLSGEGGQFQMALSELAYANGVELDREWYRIWYKGIMRGNATQEQAMRDIRNRAAAQFAGFKDQILAGQNVIDLASPYIQGMAQILEVAPGDIDLFSTEIKRALNYKDKTGTLGSMPLWQFENEMRKDPRWLKTNNAREGLMTVAHQVGQQLGVMF